MGSFGRCCDGRCFLVGSYFVFQVSPHSTVELPRTGLLLIMRAACRLPYDKHLYVLAAVLPSADHSKDHMVHYKKSMPQFVVRWPALSVRWIFIPGDELRSCEEIGGAACTACIGTAIVHQDLACLHNRCLRLAFLCW